MYEYKVISLWVKECDKKLNEYAKEGWRVIWVMTNWFRGGVVVTLERAVK